MIASSMTELQPFEDLAAQFADKELSEKREEHDAYPFGPFFSGVLEKAYEVGFLGITLPEDLGGIGQGIGLRSAVEGIARNPEASGKVTVTLLIGLAMIESLCIYALVISLILIYAHPQAAAIAGLFTG